MYDVISIGAATVDIFFKSKSIETDRSFLKFKSSSKNEISESVICSGGGATNSATTFARQKLKTACISLLGRDPLSQYILSDLLAEKIDTSLLLRPAKETTDYSIIFVGDDGGRSVFTNRGGSRLSDTDIPWKKINTSWFYITSLEGNLDLLEQLIGFAKENDIKISLNPGNREIASSRRLLSLIKQVDFLLLNGQESENLSGLIVDTQKYWQFFLDLNPLVAITNGRQGAHLLTTDDHLYSPIINTHPVDETGAGDAFGSGFISALIHHQDLETALKWGIKNSASVVSQMGAKAGILPLSKIK